MRVSPSENEEKSENRYPWWITFIIGNEFCERYAYYGMRAVLVLYLSNFLGFSKDVSTEIYHAYIAMAYMTPLLGAIISDSFWGKFKTIIIFSIIYAAGMITMAVSAVEFSDEATSFNIILCLVSLTIVAFGTGGIKPCVVTLGADQFPKTDQGAEWMKDYFAFFYASINSGSLLAIFITPIVRSHGSYFIAFLIPAVIMALAILLFLFGSKLYIKDKPRMVTLVTYWSIH